MASSLRTDEEFMELYNRYVDTVYRVCFSFMKNRADTEDMVQETFLKLMSCRKVFETTEHEKAWLVVTASNTCKDELRRFKRKMDYINGSIGQQEVCTDDRDGILQAVLALPVKYKEVVYLYHYEGYQTSEIAKMLHCPASTVRNQLSRARELLKRNGV